MPAPITGESFRLEPGPQPLKLAVSSPFLPSLARAARLRARSRRSLQRTGGTDTEAAARQRAHARGLARRWCSTSNRVDLGAPSGHSIGTPSVMAVSPADAAARAIMADTWPLIAAAAHVCESEELQEGRLRLYRRPSPALARTERGHTPGIYGLHGE